MNQREEEIGRLIEYFSKNISSLVAPHASRRNVVSAHPLPHFSAAF
jgi:hypothetical protein